ncbi:MAG: hypothetical protein LBT41_06360 [Candidatus Methanoplasma sp.]|jgi:hypothetical protein|nr:hypothetical protein [Candidatus Methanoplasma sp.]
MSWESFAATKEPLDITMKDVAICEDGVFRYPGRGYGSFAFHSFFRADEYMFSKEVLSVIPHNLCDVGWIPTIGDNLKYTDPETYLLLRMRALNGARFIREVVKRQGEFWYIKLFLENEAIEHIDVVELTVDDLGAEDLDRNLLKIEEGVFYKFIG